MLKEYCDCGKLATWCYMPGYSSGNPYHCENCVPRGCECNHIYCDRDSYHPQAEHPELPNEGEENVDWKWIEEGKIWTRLDDKRREYPCAEYDWDPDGYERDINPHVK